MRKRKDLFLTFPSICSWPHAAGMSLRAINSESVFQHVFWDTLFIPEKSSIGISETPTPRLSVQCHLTFSFVLSPEGKKPECTQKGQCFGKVSNSRWNANL